MNEQAQNNAPFGLVYSTVNPRDGAVITYTPDFVQARSQTGTVLTLYRRPLNYSLQTENATIADLATGEIAAYENGAMVTIDPQKNINVEYPNHYTRNLGAFQSPNFDAQDVLVGRHILDAQAYAQVKSLIATSGDISQTPIVKAEFGPSTYAIFEDVQRQELRKRYGSGIAG